MQIEEIKRLLERLDVAQAERRLRELLQNSHQVTGSHFELYNLCKQYNVTDLAWKELELAYRDEPLNVDIATELCKRYLELGEFERVSRIISRFEKEGKDTTAFDQFRELVNDTQTLPTDGNEEEEEDLLQSFDDSDTMRFYTLFAGREDVYARQWVSNSGTGGYTPIHEPLTPHVIKNHLLGNQTIGVYPLRLDHTVKFFAIDVDINKSALEAARSDPEFASQLRDKLNSVTKTLNSELKKLGLNPLIENSGYKGRHLWIFLEKPLNAEIIYNLGKMLSRYLAVHLPPTMHMEFFPKQAERKSPTGLGNLIKLPLGIHRKTGFRSQLVDEDGKKIQRPFEILKTVHKAGHEVIFNIVEKLKRIVPLIPDQPQAKSPTKPETADPIKSMPVPEREEFWTEADYKADRQISCLLKKCPVLGKLKTIADNNRRLEYDEQVVLMHTMGHLPQGVLAVNHIFSKCANIPPERGLKSVFKGNSISCPKIRQRIPHVTSSVDCNCSFEKYPDHYPTPLLHVKGVEKGKEDQHKNKTGAMDEEQIARRYGALKKTYREIADELKRLEDIMVENLKSRPDMAISLDEGKFILSNKDGIEQIEWISNNKDQDRPR